MSEGFPTRVVSLVPSLTEIVYALGAEDRLAGVTSFSDYPPEATAKESVGDFLSPDPEKLAVLKPDMVLLTTPTQAQLLNDLKAAGFRVAVFADPGNLEGVFTQIKAVADSLGVSDKGKTLVDSLRRSLSGIVRKDTLSLYVEISDNPLITVGQGSYLSDALKRIGLYNVFADYSQGYPAIDPEEVVKRSPDVILLLYPNASSKKVSSRIGWSEIPAVKNGMVFDSLPLNELMRPGPRLIKGLIQTSSIIRHAK